MPRTLQEDRDRILELMRGLGQSGKKFGLIHWSVDQNMDTRSRRIIGDRSIDLIEIGVFESKEGFDQWRVSDYHKEVANEMGKYADWVLGDVSDPVNRV